MTDDHQDHTISSYLTDLREDAMLLHSMVGAASAALSNPRHRGIAAGLLDQMHEISGHLNDALDSVTIGEIVRAEA